MANVNFEKYLDIFFQESPVPQAILDNTGVFIKVNESFSKLLGYTVLEFHKKTSQNITHPEDLDADIEMYKGCLAGDYDGYSMVKRYLTKTGYAVWAKIDVRYIQNEDGSFFIIWINPLPNAGRFKVEATKDELVVKPVVKLKDIFRDNLKTIVTVGSIILMSLGGAIVTFVKLASSLADMLDKAPK